MAVTLQGVRAHVSGWRFAEASALFDAVSADADDRTRFRAHGLFARRLLRLDLVDVLLEDEPELARALPRSFVDRARQLTFPTTFDAPDRGALEHTPALFGHVLEAFDIRWRRGDMLQVVALLHLIAEYAGHLAWHGALGHGADPMKLPDHVVGPESRWGRLDADDCAHGRHHRHLAIKIAERDMARSPQAWSEFLRGDYSRIGDQLSVCATRRSLRTWGTRARTCEADCPVWTSLVDSDADQLEHRVRLAAWLKNSPAVDLRHGAPVGHFFGVPDREEVAAAWGQLVRQLAKRENVMLLGDDVDAQLRDFCGKVAGRPVPASTLIADTAASMIAIASDESG